MITRKNQSKLKNNDQLCLTASPPKPRSVTFVRYSFRDLVLLLVTYITFLPSLRSACITSGEPSIATEPVHNTPSQSVNTVSKEFRNSSNSELLNELISLHDPDDILKSL